MTSRRTWTVTTHDWSKDLEEQHLAEIRSRSDVYGAGGRRHMLLEVLAYANDEAESLGREGIAVVTMHVDGSVTVADDGRGTDTRIDAAGNVVRKPVMATKDVRFFDAVDGPLLPDGLPRRGMSTVSALCPVLIHENHRADGSWSQTYRHGVPDGELAPIGADRPSGTSVSFMSDGRAGEVAAATEAALTQSDLTAFPWLRIEVRHSS